MSDNDLPIHIVTGPATSSGILTYQQQEIRLQRQLRDVYRIMRERDLWEADIEIRRDLNGNVCTMVKQTSR